MHNLLLKVNASAELLPRPLQGLHASVGKPHQEVSARAAVLPRERDVILGSRLQGLVALPEILPGNRVAAMKESMRRNNAYVFTISQLIINF